MCIEVKDAGGKMVNEKEKKRDQAAERTLSICVSFQWSMSLGPRDIFLYST